MKKTRTIESATNQGG